MEALIILLLTVLPFGMGWALFVYLARREASMPWPLYTALRGLVFAFFLMPTFLVAGHGGVPTNTFAAVVVTLIFGPTEIDVSGLMFGARGGPAVYLAPCVLGLAIYAGIFVIEVFIQWRLRAQGFLERTPRERGPR